MRKFLGLIIAGMVGVVFLAATASAQQDRYCKLVSGETGPEPVAEVGVNEDRIQFDAPGIAQTYRACGNGVLNFSGIGDVELDGWGWNPNLGWVALGAFDDDQDNNGPYRNSGVDVSNNIQFRSFIKYAPVPTAKLRGWWWNDIAGWIVLSCDDLVERGDPTACARTGNFGGTVEVATGNVSGYAWSDTMGWINLDGMTVPTLDEFNIIPDDVQVVAIPSSGQGRYLSLDSEVFAANQATGYTLGVSFFYEGASMTDRYDFDFNLLFSDRTVTDQVDNDSRRGTFALNGAAANDVGNGSSKAVINKSDVVKRFAGGQLENGFTEGGRPNYTLGTYATRDQYLSDDLVYSMAPTRTFDGSEQVETLSVASMTYAVKDPVTGSVVAFDDPTELGTNLSFTPPIQTEFTSRDQGFLSLILGPNEPIEQDVEMARYFRAPSRADYGLVLYEPEGDQGESNYVFCLTETTDDFDDCSLYKPQEDNRDFLRGYAYDKEVVRRGRFNRVSDEVQSYVQYLANQEEGQDELPSLEFRSGTGLYAFVAYRQGNTRYSYVTGHLLNSAFQVFDAAITGNARLDAYRSLTDSNQTSTGERGARTREAYLKYAQAVLRGREVPKVCKKMSSRTRLRSCMISDQDAERKVFTVQNTDDPRRLYPVDVRLSDFDDEAQEQVLVVIGRDVIINDNLYLTDDDGIIDRDRKLAIMAFENGEGVGGNVYVRGNVNIVQATIYADGSLYSISDDWRYSSTRRSARVPVRDQDMRNDLKEQIVFLGQITSENTIGGCDLPIPRFGDGTIVEDNSLLSRERACLDDLNYFRYSNMRVDGNNLVWPDNGLNDIAWQLIRESGQTQAEAAEAMRTAMRRVNGNAGQYAVVNLIYDPPARDDKLPQLPAGYTFSN